MALTYSVGNATSVMNCKLFLVAPGNGGRGKNHQYWHNPALFLSSTDLLVTPIRWGKRESWSEGYSLQTILGFRQRRQRSQTCTAAGSTFYFCVAVTIKIIALSCVSWGRRQVSPGLHGLWVVVVAAGGPCHHHLYLTTIFSDNELNGCDKPQRAWSSCLCLLQWSSLTSLKFWLLLS